MVAFYMEPELASACLRDESAPSTEAGEQYALGALVYLLWTGVHYIDWSLERSAMLRQIAEDDPVPFARRRVPVWPELEAVLRRALAKAPEARFASCAEFAGALRALLPDARRRDEAGAHGRAPARDPGADLASAFFDRCGLRGNLLGERPENPPFASVNYGAAGIAYAMYRLAVARDDAHLLATADVWAQKAVALSSQAEAFHTTQIDINEKTVGNASLFHSRSGVHAVCALVALAMGDAGSAAQPVSAFVEASRVPCEFVDITLGKAGLLVGCAALVEATKGALGVDRAALIARGIELRDEVRRLVDGEEFATSLSTSSLGFAHGWAGLLFALLRWSEANGEPAAMYGAKLDELAALQEPHGTGIRWPVGNRTVARPSYMEGWCNGSAGHALLWALAYESLGVEAYRVCAERSALSAWSSATKIGTICCGLAGIGYACAAAHRVTGDGVWLSRARLAARRGCEDRSPLFYRDSLYKGGVGAVLFREQLESSTVATPLLER
jgi:serine/threonine-protein kinase